MAICLIRDILIISRAAITVTIFYTLIANIFFLNPKLWTDHNYMIFHTSNNRCLHMSNSIRQINFRQETLLCGKSLIGRNWYFHVFIHISNVVWIMKDKRKRLTTISSNWTKSTTVLGDPHITAELQYTTCIPIRMNDERCRKYNSFFSFKAEMIISLFSSGACVWNVSTWLHMIVNFSSASFIFHCFEEIETIVVSFYIKVRTFMTCYWFVCTCHTKSQSWRWRKKVTLIH